MNNYIITYEGTDKQYKDVMCGMTANTAKEAIIDFYKKNLAPLCFSASNGCIYNQYGEVVQTGDDWIQFGNGRFTAKLADDQPKENSSEGKQQEVERLKADKEWHKIGDKLTNYLGICGCQRKLKSIIDVLVRIYDKGQTREHNWTAEEYLILAFLDSRGLITHGINCEYPIVLHMTRDNDDFWEWINSVKDNPNLDDN